MDGDVLHRLWAQQVQEVQLDATSTEDQLLRQAEQALVSRDPLLDDVAMDTMMCLIPWMLLLVWGKSVLLQ